MTRWTFGIAAALALAGAPGYAQVESKCLSGKLKGAGHAASSQVNCEAKAAAKGEAVDPECVAKAGEKLLKAFEKAENKDDCIGTGDDPAAQAVVDAFVQELLDTLNPPPAICCHRRTGRAPASLRRCEGLRHPRRWAIRRDVWQRCGATLGHAAGE